MINVKNRPRQTKSVNYRSGKFPVRKSQLPYFSVIIPVRNGGSQLQNCLESLQELNYPKNKLEIIIADNQSTDNTVATARHYRVKVVQNRHRTVGSGRNVGYSIAKGKFIAFSDADCTFDRNWLINSLKYFTDPKVGGIGGPNIVPGDALPYAKAVGIIFDSAYYFNAGSPTGTYPQVFETRFHGSNSIFRDEAIKQIFPIDETMSEGEDVLMTELLERHGWKLLYVNDVVVTHFRRASPTLWFEQMKRYGQAKIFMQRRHLKSVTFSQKLLGFFLPLLIIVGTICIVSVMVRMIVTIGVLLGMAALFYYAFSKYKSIVVGLYFIQACIILAIAWSYGYLSELFQNTPG